MILSSRTSRRKALSRIAEMPATGPEFYICHKAVVKANVETTKM